VRESRQGGVTGGERRKQEARKWDVCASEWQEWGLVACGEQESVIKTTRGWRSVKLKIGKAAAKEIVAGCWLLVGFKSSNRLIDMIEEEESYSSSYRISVYYTGATVSN